MSNFIETRYVADVKLLAHCNLLSSVRDEKIDVASPPLSLPSPGFAGSTGGIPLEFFNHLPPSLLATATASASQSGIPLNQLPIFNQADMSSTTSNIANRENGQGEAEKDAKLKEIISHIYQYVSRQYNQRLQHGEQLDVTNGTNSSATPHSSALQSRVSVDFH